MTKKTNQTNEHAIEPAHGVRRRSLLLRSSPHTHTHTHTRARARTRTTFTFIILDSASVRFVLSVTERLWTCWLGFVQSDARHQHRCRLLVEPLRNCRHLRRRLRPSAPHHLTHNTLNQHRRTSTHHKEDKEEKNEKEDDDDDDNDNDRGENEAQHDEEAKREKKEGEEESYG